MTLGAAFAAVLRMSAVAGMAALAVTALNLLLRRLKTPALLRSVLWLAVLFRLLCPVSFSAAWSPMSLLPDALTAPQQAVPQAPDSGVTPIIATQPGGDIPPLTWRANYRATQMAEQPTESAAVPSMGEVLPYLWLGGAAALLLFSVISYARLKRRLATATRIHGNIFASERVSSPFVCGLLKPRIYLPLTLSAEESAYIIRHEQIHIRRFDHLLKPLWFLACCLHWFNPLAWLAFYQMSRDMEISCDEAVLREMGPQIKAGYSGSLLALATRGQLFCPSPLAFGETGVKERVRQVLAYQKPALWLAVLTAVVVVASVAALLANPRPGEQWLEELTGTNVTLLVGVDKRPGEKSYRADTIILSFFNSDSNELKLLSVPRDSYVQLPDTDYKIKISEAYFYGGMTLLESTVEYALGVKIDHYAEMDFESFAKAIDLLGGVEIEVPQRMYKPAEEINLPRGLQTLNGADTLAFVRFRDLPMGDIDRIANQQAFLRALAAKISNELSIWKAPQLVNIAMENTRTDYTLARALSLGNAMLKSDLNSIAIYTLPGDGLYIGYISYWLLDEKGCADIITAITGGEAGELHILSDAGLGSKKPPTAW